MDLLLAERLVLLAHDQRSGRLVTRPSLVLVLALRAAVVAELLGRGSAHLQGTRIVPGAPTGDATLDWMLEAMRQSRRPRDMRHWVRRGGDLRRPLLDRLVEERVMSRERRRALGIFPVTRYRLEWSPAWEETAGQVRWVVLGGSGEIPPPVASLVALANVCRLIDRLVAPQERRAARRRAKEIAATDPGAQIVWRVLRAAQAASMSMAQNA